MQSITINVNTIDFKLTEYNSFCCVMYVLNNYAAQLIRILVL